MAYGTIKVDNITFDDGGSDRTITVSGLYTSTSGNLTVSGTISGNVIQGGTLVSGATVTGTTAQFSSGVFTSSISGASVTSSGSITAASFIPSSSTVPTNGVYLSAANTVALATNSAGRVFVDANGNVGVKTTPGVSLDVAAGSDAIAYRIRGRSSDNIGAIQFTDNGATTQYASIQTPAANTLAFLTASTERLRLTSDGRLGVGTSAPGTPLSISHPSNAFIEVTDSTAAKSNYIGTNPSGDLDLNGSGSQNILFKTAGNERVRIDSSGRVGIGTASPGVNLEIAGTTPAIRLTETDSTGFSQVYVDGAVLTIDVDPTAAAASSAIRFNVDNTERLRLTSDGRLGVGTSAPDNLADVNGAVGVLYGGANGGLRLFRNTGTVNNAILQHTFTGGNDQLEIAPAGNSATSAIAFLTATGSTLGTRMLISPAGNVGIGTASPSSTLTVVGAMRLGASPTASYVEHGNNGSANYISSVSEPLAFFTSFAERARIDSSGRLLVGTSSARANLFNSTVTADLQVESTNGFLSITRNGNDAISSGLVLGKSRSSGNTIVSSGDGIGLVTFQGNDGSEFVEGARIEAVVDGTPGANDMPGRLVFSTTADGASSPTERMRITNGGLIYCGTTSEIIGSSYRFHIEGTRAISAKGTAGATSPVMSVWNNAASGDNVFIDFRTETSDTTRGSITYNRGGGVVAYNTTSDYRAKTLLGDLQDTGSTIDAFKVYNGVMHGAVVERPMLVAHEAQEVAPYCVTGQKDAVDADGNAIYQQIDHQVLVPLLIAEIQQLRSRVAALEAA